MKLPVSHLIPGMKLVRPVYGLKGQMLLNRGVELTASYIQGLKYHHILAVTVEDVIELDEQEAGNILEEAIRVQALSSIQTWVQSNRKQDDFTGVVDSVDSIVDEILSGKIPSGGLAEISTTDIYTFAHSIDVCALSVYMGIKYGYKKAALLMLGVGSILHDLGKTKIPPEILHKPGKLTEDEFEEIKNHPVFGYNMLVDEVSDQLQESSLEIVLNHHERHDGSGYPKGLKGNDISDMTAICALSDIYSALTTDHLYRKALPANEAYEMILACGDRQFKMRMIRLFAACICPYSVGSLVLLSTREIAQVTAINSNLPFRPVITMLDSKKMVDLSQELSIVIRRALTDDEAKSALINYRLGK